MKLSRKVFLYTATTTFLVGLLIISYFMFMLPGLFASHKSQAYMNGVEKVQRDMMQGGGCDIDVTSNETLTTIGVSIPRLGYTVPVCNPYFSGEFEIQDKELKTTFDQLRSIIMSFEDRDESEETFDMSIFDTVDWSPVQNLVESNSFKDKVKFSGFEGRNLFETEDNVLSDQRITNDGIAIMSTQVGDDANNYTNYFAFSKDDDAIYVTFGSTMTPKLNELVPIVSSSVPMIFSVLILIVLVTAGWFSKKLAGPVETLAKQAQFRNETDGVVFRQDSRGDEFEVLENALNTMHNDLKEMVQDLDKRNQELIAMQSKQEVFLMNASHQLKTPISSASLLVQGMIDKVGKYKDTDIYLPKVTEELKTMQTIIESMMVIFQEKHNEINVEAVDVRALMRGLVEKHSYTLNQKGINVTNVMTDLSVASDQDLLASILDNIISNAVKYTPNNNQIVITNVKSEVTVLSEGIWIEEDLLKNIKQAFVRSHNTSEKGSGLGLYLVETFTQMLGYTWKIENIQEGVLVTINLKGESI